MTASKLFFLWLTILMLLPTACLAENNAADSFPSAEELADQYVADSGEECSVEEMTIGEGEYPALWVSYAEGTEPDSRSCSLYVFRYNSVLYVAQLDGMVGDTQLAGELNTILSTLRFDEG